MASRLRFRQSNRKREIETRFELSRWLVSQTGPKTRLYNGEWSLPLFSRKRRAQNETRFFVFVETRSKTRKGICQEKVKSKKVRKTSPKKNSHAVASKYQRREIMWCVFSLVRAMATKGLSVDNISGVVWGKYFICKWVIRKSNGSRHSAWQSSD